MLVREMQRSDLQPVRYLAAQLGYEVGLDELGHFFRALADDPDDLLVVAVHNVGVVGWAHAHLTRLLYRPPFAEITGLIVDAAHRNLGAGRALMQAVEAWAGRSQCAQVRIRTRTSRVHAHLVYERLGYANEKTQYVFAKRLVRSD